MEKATLTVKEAAAVLGICLPRMYELTEQENFPLLKIGRRKLILKEHFFAWMKQQAEKTLV